MAKKGLGKTHPNPYVGCVLVSESGLVGEGFHESFGKIHAEAMAIEDAKKRSGGQLDPKVPLTLYSTLEPCDHFGKTPPCTQAILQNRPPIHRVVIGTIDPSPFVSGKGIDRLKKGGVDVHIGVCAQECLQMNEDYFHWVKTRLPYVTLKVAVSLDGRMAAPDKSSKWISSSKGLAFAHRLRYQADAILVGIETVLADNPRLTARTLSGRVMKEPIRVILDSGLRLPGNALMINQENPSKTWIFCASDHDAMAKKALMDKGVSVFVVNKASEFGGLDLKEILALLGSRGMINLLVEGGSRVLSSFVLSGLYDKLYMNIAPKIIGKHGVPFIQETGFSSIQEILTLNLVNLRRNGTDILAVLKKGS